VKKARDADLLCEMIRFALERLSTLEVGVVMGAACGKTDPARRACGRPELTLSSRAFPS